MFWYFWALIVLKFGSFDAEYEILSGGSCKRREGLDKGVHTAKWIFRVHVGVLVLHKASLCSTSIPEPAEITPGAAHARLGSAALWCVCPPRSAHIHRHESPAAGKRGSWLFAGTLWIAGPFGPGPFQRFAVLHEAALCNHLMLSWLWRTSEDSGAVMFESELSNLMCRPVCADNHLPVRIIYACFSDFGPMKGWGADMCGGVFVQLHTLRPQKCHSCEFWSCLFAQLSPLNRRFLWNLRAKCFYWYENVSRWWIQVSCVLSEHCISSTKCILDVQLMLALTFIDKHSHLWFRPPSVWD